MCSHVCQGKKLISPQSINHSMGIKFTITKNLYLQNYELCLEKIILSCVVWLYIKIWEEINLNMKVKDYLLPILCSYMQSAEMFFILPD